MLANENDRKDKIHQFCCSFLCGAPLKCFIWDNFFTEWEVQEEIINNTVRHERNQLKPLRVKYQINFLKFFISKLEPLEGNIHDCVYESLSKLLLLSEVDQKCFKHYCTPGGIISLEENLQTISQGTTGLNTWEAALVLSEWCNINKDFLRDKKVLELGSGIGLLGLVIAKNCRPKKIVLSDSHAKVLQKLNENIKENLTEDEYVEVKEIQWENVSPLVANDINPDLILAADVVYDPALFSGLINAVILLLAANAKAEFILACTERNPQTLNDFVSLLEDRKLLVTEEQTPRRRWFVWSSEVPIKIFRVSLIKN